MIVKWEQLKRILTLEVTFRATNDEYESYTIPDHLVLRIVHSDYDGGIYTANYVQLYNLEDDGFKETVCVIQLEGTPEDPISFNIEGGEVDLMVFRHETPNELFWPVLN